MFDKLRFRRSMLVRCLLLMAASSSLAQRHRPSRGRGLRVDLPTPPAINLDRARSRRRAFLKLKGVRFCVSYGSAQLCRIAAVARLPCWGAKRVDGAAESGNRQRFACCGPVRLARQDRMVILVRRRSW